MLNWLTYKVLAYVAGVLAVIVAVMGLALWAQEVRVSKAQNERDKANNKVAEVQGDLKRARESIAGYQDAVKQCNDAVANLKNVSDEKQRQADDMLARLRKENERYKESDRRLAKLSAAPTPQGATCQTALVAIRRELRR